MSAHIVRPGEHLRAICFRRGLNADKVWRSPDNEELRKTREDPAILCPGDILHLPAAEPKFLPVKIGAVNTYVTCVPTIPVKIVVQGYDKPLKGEPYAIEGLGDRKEGTTDSDGYVTADVPVDCPSFLLVLTERALSYHVLVGHLDPLAEESGIFGRLSNLGYVSPIGHLLARYGIELADSPTRIQAPLRAFQKAKGLPVTGKPDSTTLDALKRGHGI